MQSKSWISFAIFWIKHCSTFNAESKINQPVLFVVQFLFALYRFAAIAVIIIMAKIRTIH